MQKDLERKLNNFKKIKASQEWKTNLKSELFQEEEHFLLQIVQPKLAFGSLAMVGMALALIIIGGAREYPQVQMVENRIDHRVMTAVEMMQEEPQQEEESGMMAMSEDQEDQSMTAEIDIDSLDDLPEDYKDEIIRRSTQEMMAELDEIEERLAKVLGSR